jgi:hypothetical protein
VLESNADRLALIKGAGGELVLVDGAGVWAIFTDAHTPLQFGDQIISSSEPQILARSSDLEALVDGSVIKRGSLYYGVAAIEPDGTGMTTIRLRVL